MAKKVAGTLYESITGQLFEIGRQLRQPKGYSFDPEALHRHLQSAIEGKFLEILAGRKFLITIDYTRKLKDMICAGKYDWVNPNITQKNFPITEKGSSEKEVVLFHFDKSMSSEQVIAEMDKQGFKPGNIEELLALGASQPDLQRQFPIIALSSVWRDPGGRRVPYLYGDRSRRKLVLGWFDYSWGPSFRFVAVRK